MSNLARILGKPNGRPSFAPDNRWILPSDLIGVEFEYEGVKDQELPKHTYADFFKFHEETSLKDNGAEYTFATPLFGVDAFNAISWITSHAAESKWKCSKRTGIHIHLDVRDLEAQQLAGMAILYAAVEPLLYKWVGEGRESSHFCLPLYSSDDALVRTCTIIRSALQDDTTGGINTLHHAENFLRYSGFNLNALAKFGSVEFRQLQTTHSLSRIVDWINMLMAIKACAFKLPTSDRVIIKMMERMGVLDTLLYIFPQHLAVQLYDKKDSEFRFLELGLPSARDIAIHGCTKNAWVAPKMPRGDSAAFLTWAKSYSKEKKNKTADFLQRIDDHFQEGGLGDGLWDAGAAVVVPPEAARPGRVRPAVPPIQARPAPRRR